MSAPDSDMMMVVARLARFIAIGGVHLPPDLFAPDAVIVENFAPFLFEGPDAVARWAEAMRHHLKDLTHLRHEFGAAIDFGRDGASAYFSLPTIWRGFNRGVAFAEEGGWGFVLTRRDRWAIKAYGWAVTKTDAPPT